MGGEGLTFSRRVQWTSEATRPSHHRSSIVAYAAPRSEATGLSGRTLRGHELPQRTQRTRTLTFGIPIRPRPGAPLPTTSAELGVAAHPGKAAVSPPLCSWDLGRPGAVQSLAELSSLLQKLQRKLPTPLARPRLGLQQRPPARRPQLLPRRPAFVLLPHPALGPGRNSRIPLRRGGLRAPSPSQGSAGGPSRPALHALDGRLRSPAHPGAAAPLRALGSRSGSQSLGRRGPPSLAKGIGGRASRMRCQPPYPAGRGAGNWSLSFACAGCFLPTLLPRLGGKLPLTLAETRGGLLGTPRAYAGSAGTAAPPARTTRETRGQDAPESSVSCVRCSCQRYVGSTCFVFVWVFFFEPVLRWGGRYGQFPRKLQKSHS